MALTQVLSGSQGNLLEDEVTIGIITEVKQLGNEIAEKQVLMHCLCIYACMPDASHVAATHIE